jgi:hypothetical protein
MATPTDWIGKRVIVVHANTDQRVGRTGSGGIARNSGTLREVNDWGIRMQHEGYERFYPCSSVASLQPG